MGTIAYTKQAFTQHHTKQILSPPRSAIYRPPGSIASLCPVFVFLERLWWNYQPKRTICKGGKLALMETQSDSYSLRMALCFPVHIEDQAAL